ncbi:MAG: hypothetical protein OEY94_04560 [Alphaproteobacteria bacterium]|nr:hypothetical protein [Alphaproteobacteria bacterium]
MTFELLVLIAIIACALIAFFYCSFQSFNTWRKAILVDAEIIGYKWSQLPGRIYIMTSPVTGFWPIIQYKIEDQVVRAPIKNISLLIPVRTHIKVRITNKNSHAKMGFLSGASIFGLLVIGIFYKIMSIDIFPFGWSLGLIVLAIPLMKLLNDYKNLGTLQDTLIILTPAKRPKNYEEMTEADFKRIEESDLVSYEEAMAHYYHRNKKSEKWVYTLIAIVIAALLFYKWL